EPKGSIAVRPYRRSTIATVARELFRTYPTRTLLGITLMVTQSFLYNAIFFTYALVLAKFYDVPSSHVGLYILPFAVGNF
ncbi:MAG: MFS transporter, partial [Nitrospiraceae bacterium]